MKLQKELPGVIEKFQSIPISKLSAHIKILYESGRYKDFETRIAWDCLHACKVDIIRWYKIYNCTDKHITTLAKIALKEIFDVNEFINTKR